MRKNENQKYYLTAEQVDDISKKIYKREKITFNEFISMIYENFELEFYYNKKHFGVTQFDGYEIYEWDKEDGYQSYRTIDEFVEKASIDGKLLKDVFKDVKKIYFA